MRYKILLIVALLVVGVSGLAAPADACSCMESGPPCQAFWKAEAVFDATVVAIAPMERAVSGDLPHDDTLVTVDVHAGHRGATAGPLQITTYSDDAGCGYPFKTGKRYLMFARRAADGRLSVSLCSATREFDGTGPAAAFLSSLSKPATGGRVFGTVQTWLGSVDGPTQRTPVQTRVELHGPGGVLRTSSVGGQFQFSGLSEGGYRLEVAVPDGYAGYSASREVQIADARGCAEANVSFSPAGRISGRLVDASGRPLRRLRVELTGADAKPHPDYGLSTRSTMTETDGAFVLEGVSPGRYIVGVNLNDLPNESNPYARAVYPGAGQEPHVIELTLGQAVDLGIWTIPSPLAVVAVSGVVVRPDGTPVANVYVGSWDVTGDPVARARGAGGSQTGPDGRFELKLRQGRVYTFTVRDGNGPALRIDAPRIETSSGAAQTIRIVILDRR